jgi:hypothetical protein
MDLGHWSAFQRSFEQLAGLLRKLGAGGRRACVGYYHHTLGGVHHAYLAKALLPEGDSVKSVIYQPVCSPLRNVLDTNEQHAVRAGWSKLGARIGETLVRPAGVRPPGHWTGNSCMMSLGLAGGEPGTRPLRARVRIERPTPSESAEPESEEVFSCALYGG